MPTHLVNFRLISQIDISTYLKHQLIASALYLRSRWDRLRVCAWNVSSAYMAICDRLECLRFYIEWISLLNVTRHRVSPFRGRIMKSGTITWDFPSGHYATSTCPPPQHHPAVPSICYMFFYYFVLAHFFVLLMLCLH